MSETPPPMTLGQILDRTFGLIRAYWQLFLAVGVVPAAAASAVMMVAIAWWLIDVVPLFLADPSHMHIPIWPAILIGAGNLIPIPILALYAPAGMYAATQANLGIKAGFREAYGVAWRHYRRYLGLMALLLLYAYVPLIVVGTLVGGGAWLMVNGTPPGAIPAGIFLLIPAGILAELGFLVYWVLIMLRFVLAYPACVAEDLTARAALRRSATLTRGARGRIFAVLLIVYVATYAVVMVVTTAFEFVAGVAAVAGMAAHITIGSAPFHAAIGLGAFFFMLLMIAYSALIYAAFSAAVAVIYHHQRWRKDGAAAAMLPA